MSGFEPALRAVALRVRLQRALSTAATAAIAGLGLAALGLCLLKTGHPQPAQPLLALAIALPLLGLAAGALRSVSPLLAARLLDRVLGRPDLLASAWSFSRMAAAERSAFMQACIRQAHAHAPAADPRRALPLRAPRALRPALVLLLGLFALTALEVKVRQPIAAQPPTRARLLHQDDLQAFAAEVAPLLRAQEQDALVRETASQLNALLEALHEGELDRAEALAELRALEKKLELDSQGEADEALREALRGLGRTLEHDALAMSVAEAMQAGDAERARQALESLAAQLRQGGQRVEALRKLGQTLQRAGKPPEQNERAQAKARAELERLLKQREQAKPRDERQERLLRDKKRELERLQREQQQRSQAERQLDELRRELSQASQSAQAQRGADASRDLEQAAQAMSRAQSQQLSAEQRKQLKERLQQLRELLSKQRQQQQQQAGTGKPQPGQAQRLDLDRFAALSRGKPGEDGKSGEGKEGAQLLLPGKGSESDPKLLLPGQGQQQVLMPSESEALLPGGREAGQGGKLETADPTRMQSTRIDTRVQGEQGKGATRSEAIREAGQRGFVTRDYERVHADYVRHAENVLERDRIPGGYRFYVRRYFQLIRPREGEP
jgi:hypothetical protein